MRYNEWLTKIYGWIWYGINDYLFFLCFSDLLLLIYRHLFTSLVHVCVYLLFGLRYLLRLFFLRFFSYSPLSFPVVAGFKILLFQSCLLVLIRLVASGKMVIGLGWDAYFTIIRKDGKISGA